MIIFTHLPSKRVVSVLILYNFTQIQKYFTLALLVLLVTNIMSGENDCDGDDNWAGVARTEVSSTGERAGKIEKHVSASS